MSTTKPSSSFPRLRILRHRERVVLPASSLQGRHQGHIQAARAQRLPGEVPAARDRGRQDPETPEPDLLPAVHRDH